MKRDLTIDTLKGFLILCVILGHLIGSLNVSGGEAIWNLIYTYHMPLFILISGYFSKQDRPNVSTLLKPLVVFQTINVIIFSILGHKFSFTYFFVPHWTLWYLLSLVFWRLMLRYTPKVLLNRPYVYLGIAMVASLAIGLVMPYGRILSIQRTISFFPFFLMGYYFQSNLIKQKLWGGRLSIIFLIIISLIVILGYYPIDAKVLLRGADPYGIDELASKLFLFLCSIVCVYSLWNLRFFVPYMEKIGKDSLFYYLYHGLIIQFFIVPIVGHFNLSTNLLYTIVYFFFIIVAIHLMSKLSFYRWLVNPQITKKIN